MSPRLPLGLRFAVASASIIGTVHGSCPPPGTKLTISGSWVVQPIVTAWADFFDCPGVSVSVERGSNEEGINRVCGVIADPTEMGGTTRVVRHTEATSITTSSGKNSTFQCLGSQRQITAVDIALDGLVIFAVSEKTASQCLETLGTVSVHQMRWMFSNWTEKELSQTDASWDLASTIPNSDGDPDTKLWCELSPNCPCWPILTAGSVPGTRPHQYMAQSSGFAESEYYADSHKQFTNRSDLIQYVDQFDAAVGYMRFAEYTRVGASLPMLKAVPVRNPSTGESVPPTSITLASDAYIPYSRRAYLYVWTEAMEDVLPFIQFGFSELGTSLIDQVDLVPLPEEERTAILARLGKHVTTSAPSSVPSQRTVPSSTTPGPSSSAPNRAAWGIAVVLIALYGTKLR